MSQESAYNILKVHSRDNARTPMQWDGSENGGFTGGTPWISVNPNCEKINAAAQVDDPDSIFSYYKTLIQLRREHDVISQGDFAPLDPENPSVLAYRRSWEGTELLENPSVLAYRRSWEGTELLCVSNFYRKPCTWKCPVDLEGYRVLLANYPDPKPEPEMALRPYESMILLRRP